MTKKEITKLVEGDLVEKDHGKELEKVVGGRLDTFVKKCSWTQFHFQSRVKSPQQGHVIRFKTGCSGRSHGELYKFCPDCGGKTVKVIL